MKREDIEKLVGGYATGTLTPEERRALYEAALSDQVLFDALANEEALREVLEDPQTRRQLENALRGGKRPGWTAWLRQPRAWGLAGALAATIVLGVVVIRTGTAPSGQVQMAKQEAPAAAIPPQTPPPAAAGPRDEKKPGSPPAKLAPREAHKRAAAAPVYGEPSRVLGAPATGGAVAREVELPPPPVTVAAEASGVVPAADDRLKLSATRNAPSAPAAPPPPPAAAVVAAQAEVGARLAASAPAPALSLRYTLLPVMMDERDAAKEAKAKEEGEAAAPVQVALEPSQDGFLEVRGVHGILFSGRVQGGKRVTVVPTSDERHLTAVLSRQPLPSGFGFASQQALRKDRGQYQQMKGAADTVVVEIDLKRKNP